MLFAPGQWLDLENFAHDFRAEGIQAQTLSVFHHALDADLTLLPVINKVDLPHASPAETSEQIESSLGLSRDTHMPISAKSGMGVDEVLRRVVEDLPAPRKWEDEDGKLRGLVFDTLCVHFHRSHRSSSNSDAVVAL
jgi:GTP-binding protein LepA